MAIAMTRASPDCYGISSTRYPHVKTLNGLLKYVVPTEPIPLTRQRFAGPRITLLLQAEI